MALAWNAGWVNALRGSNPLSSATEPLGRSPVEGLVAYRYRAGAGLAECRYIARIAFHCMAFTQILAHRGKRGRGRTVRSAMP